MTYDLFRRNDRFAGLDGLRAISIIAVVWHHATTGGLLLRRGFLGVDLFFVISGFLIVTLLLREQKNTGSVSLPGFYFRRALRILPPYFVMLAIVGCTALLKSGDHSAVRHDLPYAIFFASNFVAMQSMLGITWSLSVEEQFYAVIPALTKWFRDALPFLLAALCVVSVIVAVLPIDAPTFFKQTTFTPIILGSLLAVGLNNRAVFDRLSALLSSPAIWGVIVLLLAAVPISDISGVLRFPIHVAMACLVGAAVLRGERGLLSNPVLVRIGKVSYGIYLYHLIAQHFVTMGLSNEPLVFVGTLLLSWAAAEVSFRWIERPALSLKARAPFHTGVRQGDSIAPGDGLDTANSLGHLHVTGRTLRDA